MTTERPPRNPAHTRQRLLDATVRLVLRQGFNASTVDQICAEAGVTKGSFFYHFKTKDDIGKAAIGCFADMGNRLYAAAWEENPAAGPLEQIHRLFEIMIGFTGHPDDPCVCAVGMMAQEMAATHPEIRDECARYLGIWTEMMRERLEAAKQLHRPARDFDAEKVAWYLNSLWQGSMLVAKTVKGPELIADNIRLARVYVDSLFELAPSNSETTTLN